MVRQGLRGALTVDVAAQLWLKHDHEVPESVAQPGAQLLAFSRGYTPGASQDGLLVASVGGARLLAVADGAGGLPSGGRAAELALRSLLRAVSESPVEDDSLRHGVLEGFDAASAEIQALGGGAACTLAVAVIDAGVLRTYHAGDSAVLVAGQRGKLKLATIAHSPVGYALEAGYLSEQEAMEHDERHLVSNLLGSTDMRIEIGPVLQLAARDTVLLASDGLFDNLRLAEIVALVRHGPLAAAAARLAEATLQRMLEPATEHPSKPDDLSFLLLREGARPRPAG